MVTDLNPDFTSKFDMNKQFDELIYQSGLIAQGCWDELGTYEQDAIERLADLIVGKCIQIVEGDTSAEHVYGGQYHANKIKKYFGVDE